METFGDGYDTGERQGEANERRRLRPLLKRCEDLAEGVRFNHPDEWERNNLGPLLADLRAELGKS